MNSGFSAEQMAGAAERIRKRLVPNANGCHEWPKPRPDGYGHVGIGKRGHMLAHRAIWIATNGEIPEGKYLMHSCDNRACCNLAHLSIGSAKDNSDDMRAKRRHSFGKKHGDARRKTFLSPADRADIVAAYEGGESQRSLAGRYRVAQGVISNIVNGTPRLALDLVAAGREIGDLQAQTEHLQAENKRLREALRLVDEQANDEGLWFRAQTAPEAYLQAALRRLHAALEDPTP